MPSDSNPFSKTDHEPIGREEWESVRRRFGSFWEAKSAPHHSIIAQTRGGKSWLIANGILSHRTDRNVLIIDVKGDDPTYEAVGKPVSKLPSRFKRTFNDWLSEASPREHWYRLVVHEDWDAARKQVKKALEQVYAEHDWTVVLDETRALTDARVPSLNLGPQVEQLWLRGGSKGIEVVAATQGPRWVPRSFYEQAQFHWIGAIEDEESQKRLREIGGMERGHLETIKTLPRHHFVYTDRMEDKRYRAITKVE